MLTVSRPRRPGAPSPARAVVVGALLGAAVVLGSAAPAAAHDQVASTSPADGTVVDGPTTVTLTFTEPVLDVGDRVQVTGPAGVVPGALTVDGDRVVQTLAGAVPSGAYTVAWRVVSADGHPVSGTFAFTASTPAPSGTSTAPTAPTAGAAGSPPDRFSGPTAAVRSDEGTANGSRPATALLAGALVLGAGGCVIAITRARRGGASA